MNRASSRTYTHPSFTASCAARFSPHPSSSRRDRSSPRHLTPFASTDASAPSGSAGTVTRRSPPPADGQMRRLSLTPPPLARNAEDLTRDPALRIDEAHASTSRLGERSRGDYQAHHAHSADAARQQRPSADEAGSSWHRGEGQRSSFGSSSGVNEDSSSRRRPDLKLTLAPHGGAGKSDGSERGQDRLPGIAQLDEYLASPWPKPAVPANTPSRFPGPGDTFRRERESLPPLGLPGFASSSSSSAPHSSTWDSSSRQNQAASLPSPSGSIASSQLGYEQMERRPSLTQLGRRTSAVLLDRTGPDGRPYSRSSLLSPRPADAHAHPHSMARSHSQAENREAMQTYSEQHASQKRKASFDASPMPSSAAVQASLRPHTSGLPPQPFVSHQGRDFDGQPRPRSHGDRWHEDANKRRREHERWSPERQPASGLPAARESRDENVRYTGGPSYSTSGSNAGSAHDRHHYASEEQRHAYDREQAHASRHHLAASASHPHYLRGDGVDRGYPSGHGLQTSRSYPSPSNRHEQYRDEHAGQYGRYPGGPDEREAGSIGAPGARKRGKLPKAVTDLLKSWLLEHATHPYPTDEEKRRLCAATGLTMSQVSNWFINARRRILVPSPSGGFAVGGTAAAEQVREMFQAEPHHHGSRGQDPRHARQPSPPRYAYHHEQHERYARR